MSITLPPFEQVLGTIVRKRIRAFDDDGRPVEDLLFTDPVSAVLWTGDDMAPLVEPVVAWEDAPNGVLTLTIPSAMTADLDPGTYRYQVFVTPPSDGERRCLVDGSVRFLPTAGSGTPDPVYATAEDLFDHCPRIEQQLLSEESAQTGFAEERAKARKWFDDKVVRMYHPVPGRQRRMVDLSGDASGPYLLFADAPEGAIVPTDVQLRAMLDAGGLVVTDIIRECVSNKAAAYAYRTARGGGYAEEAGRHEGMANRLWWESVVEVKSDPELDAPDLRIGREVMYLT